MYKVQTKWKFWRALFLSPGRNLSTMVDLDKKKVVLYGAGQLGIEVAYRIQTLDVTIVQWVDQGANNQVISEFNININLPRDIQSVEFDFVIICSDIYKQEMFENCISMGILKNKIVII